MPLADISNISAKVLFPRDEEGTHENLIGNNKKHSSSTDEIDEASIKTTESRLVLFQKHATDGFNAGTECTVREHVHRDAEALTTLSLQRYTYVYGNKLCFCGYLLLSYRIYPMPPLNIYTGHYISSQLDVEPPTSRTRPASQTQVVRKEVAQHIDTPTVVNKVKVQEDDKKGFDDLNLTSEKKSEPSKENEASQPKCAPHTTKCPPDSTRLSKWQKQHSELIEAIMRAAESDDRFKVVSANGYNARWSCALCNIKNLTVHSVKQHCLGNKHTLACQRMSQETRGKNDASPSSTTTQTEQLIQEKANLHRPAQKKSSKPSQTKGAALLSKNETKRTRANVLHPKLKQSSRMHFSGTISYAEIVKKNAQKEDMAPVDMQEVKRTCTSLREINNLRKNDTVSLEILKPKQVVLETSPKVPPATGEHPAPEVEESKSEMIVVQSISPNETAIQYTKDTEISFNLDDEEKEILQQLFLDTDDPVVAEIPLISAEGQKQEDKKTISKATHISTRTLFNSPASPQQQMKGNDKHPMSEIDAHASVLGDRELSFEAYFNFDDEVEFIDFDSTIFEQEVESLQLTELAREQLLDVATLSKDLYQYLIEELEHKRALECIAELSFGSLLD